MVVSSVMVPALMEETSEGLSMDLEEASWIRELVCVQKKFEARALHGITAGYRVLCKSLLFL